MNILIITFKVLGSIVAFFILLRIFKYILGHILFALGKAAEKALLKRMTPIERVKHNAEKLAKIYSKR